MGRRAAVALAAAALGGCSFSTHIAGDPNIQCSGGEACPSGYTCRSSIGRCVPLADLEQPAVALSGAAVAPAIGNAETSFTLTFEVSASLAQLPVAYASAVGDDVQTYPFTCGSCSPGSTCSCALRPGSLQPEPPEGTYRVWVALVDVLGNAPPPSEVGSLAIDLTPPELAGSADLTLIPAAGVTTPISELGPGGGAQVCFQVTETLASGSPQVWAAGPGDAGVLGFALEPNASGTSHYCFLGAVDGGGLDGPKAISASLEDLAGNLNLVVLIDPDGGLVVDTVPPPPPGTGLDGGLVFHRAPWGQLPDLTRPVFTLGASGAAIPKEGTLLVYGDAAREFFLGQGQVGVGPVAPPLPLPGPDFPQVFVDLVDRAGNRAPGGPFPVLNVEWVATLGGKVVGETLLNPHDCMARPVFEGALLQGDDPETAQGAPASDGGAIAIPGAGTWWQRVQGFPGGLDFTAPNSLADIATAYDSAQGSTLVTTSIFEETGGVKFETWTYDGDWRLFDGVSPTYRLGSSLSYDSRRGVAVLFGGESQENGVSESGLCDTWEWNGSFWSEAHPCNLPPDGGPVAPPAPSPRFAAAMAYDRVQGKTVLFGGDTVGGTVLGDLWTYDGSRWSALALDAGAPPPLAQASLAFVSCSDGGSGLMLAGGSTFDVSIQPTFVNATWWGSWTGSTYSWTPAFSNPACDPAQPPCAVLQLAATPTGQVVLASGSADGDGGSAFWTWNGANGWIAGPSVASNGFDGFVATPGARSGPYLLIGSTPPFIGESDYPCDATLSCVVGHGGNPSTPLQTITPLLAFDDQGNGYVYDTSQDTTIAPLELLVWTGAEWNIQPVPGTAGPSFRSGGALAFDPASGLLWLAGGIDTHGNPLSDVWTLDPNAGWTQQLELSSQALGSASLVYVPQASFGQGMALGNVQTGSLDTDLLAPAPDGGVVTGFVTEQPQLGNLVWDQGRARLVLVGSNAPLQLDELGGAAGDAWSLTQTGPSIQGALAAYDPVDQRTLIAGTVDDDVVPGDLHAYAGGAITRVPLADPEGDGNPGLGASAGPLAFDAAQGALTAFNPEFDLSAQSSTTWQFREAPYRPGLACQFRFAAAEAPAGSSLQSILVEGSGGADPSGAELDIWQAGAWLTAATCDGGCPSEAPMPLSFETHDPTQMALLLSDLNTLGAAIASSGPNGTGQAQVSAGPLQATVTYRLP